MINDRGNCLDWSDVASRGLNNWRCDFEGAATKTLYCWFGKCRSEYHLPVPVPIETASNMEEVRLYEEKKKAAQAAGQPL